MSVIVQWEGDDDVMIYGHTNPWLRASDGTDVDIADLISKGLVGETYDGTCYACGPGILAGVLAPMDSPIGIQTCDNCELYDSDLAAAQALAEHLTVVLELKEPYTVWFEKDTGPEVFYDCPVHGPDCYGCVYEVEYTKG